MAGGLVIQSKELQNIHASKDPNTVKFVISYSSLIYLTWFVILRLLMDQISTSGVSTLSWWWGLSAAETLRAVPAVE
jgi:hypothetical protein